MCKRNAIYLTTQTIVKTTKSFCIHRFTLNAQTETQRHKENVVINTLAQQNFPSTGAAFGSRAGSTLSACNSKEKCMNKKGSRLFAYCYLSIHFAMRKERRSPPTHVNAPTVQGLPDIVEEKWWKVCVFVASTSLHNMPRPPCMPAPCRGMSVQIQHRRAQCKCG